MNKQASLLATVARTAEVSRLKWDQEHTEEELGLVKRQLEENKGTQFPVCIYIKEKLLILIEAS